MSYHMTEIVVGVVGVATTATAWMLGGRQRTKNESDDTLTKGANQIVETSNNLLTTLQTMLSEERTHRQDCETKLRDLGIKIDELEKFIKP